MVLAASLVVHDERARYLPIVIEHLRGFTDQITILDDHSTDGTLDWLRDEVDEQLCVAANDGQTFDQHEGHVRQKLLSITLARHPDFVLAIDGDELIGDGAALRAMLEASPDTPALTLQMHEVWRATPEAMQIRVDGAWRPYQRTHLWKVPETIDQNCTIPERKLACPPVPFTALHARAVDSGQQIFHFGWTDQTTRQARYDRYMRLDGGRYHARSHLNSIISGREQTQPMPWPDADWVDKVKEKLL